MSAPARQSTDQARPTTLPQASALSDTEAGYRERMPAALNTAPEPAPPAPPPSQAAPSAPAPQRDFEFERSRPAAPRTPVPAPTEGGGEFF